MEVVIVVVQRLCEMAKDSAFILCNLSQPFKDKVHSSKEFCQPIFDVNVQDV